MSPQALAILLFFAFCSLASADGPRSILYPFPDTDLQEIRRITKAETIPASQELNEAWRLYGELKGGWMPNAPKPAVRTIAQLDLLKSKLERSKTPEWFSKALRSPRSSKAELADKIGDPIFERQRDTSEFQRLKALAIVYLTEHELDREGSASHAGTYLTILTIAHTWDWELHALYARLLIDAGQAGPGWQSATLSIFLNPSPSLKDLEFFAFVGSSADKKQWPEIQIAIRQAAPDAKIAEEAITASAPLFSDAAKLKLVPANPP